MNFRQDLLNMKAAIADHRAAFDGSANHAVRLRLRDRLEQVFHSAVACEIVTTMTIDVDDLYLTLHREELFEVVDEFAEALIEGIKKLNEWNGFPMPDVIRLISRTTFSLTPS